jgi:hypothetical protein
MEIIQALSKKYEALGEEGFSPLPKALYNKLLHSLPKRMTEELARCEESPKITIKAGKFSELLSFNAKRGTFPPGYFFPAVSEHKDFLGTLARQGLHKPDNDLIRFAPVITVHPDIVKEALEASDGFRSFENIMVHELAHGIMATPKHPKELGLLSRHELNRCMKSQLMAKGRKCLIEEEKGESKPGLWCDVGTSIDYNAQADIAFSHCRDLHPPKVQEGDCKRIDLMSKVTCQDRARENIDRALLDPQRKKERTSLPYSLAATAAATIFRTAMRHYVIPACFDYLIKHNHITSNERQTLTAMATHSVEFLTHVVKAGDPASGLINHLLLEGTRFIGKKIGINEATAEGMVAAVSTALNCTSIDALVTSATSVGAHGGAGYTASSAAQFAISKLPKLKEEDEAQEKETHEAAVRGARQRHRRHR